MRFLLLCLTLCFSLSVSSKGCGTPTFTGNWEAKADDQHSFALELVQTGDQIKGYHNAVARHGNRLDAALPSDGVPSIEGTVVDGVAHIKFKSSYSGATGEATMTIKGKKLEWKISDSSGLHYLPLSEVLHRKPGK